MLSSVGMIQPSPPMIPYGMSCKNLNLQLIQLSKEPSNPSIVLVDQNICAVVQEQEMHNLKVKIKNKPTDLGNSTLEFLLACLDLGNFGEEKGICDDDAQVQRQFKKFSKQIENAKEDDKIWKFHQHGCQVIW